MKRRLVLAALSLALLPSATCHAIPFRTVALSGQAAPETPAGILFDEFTHAVINQSGDVAFNAVVAGPGVTSSDTGGSTGIWATHPGGTRKVVRSGDQAVDSAVGVLIGTSSRARIDDQSRVAFVATSAPQFANRLFSEGLGVLRGIDPPTSSSSPGFGGNGNLAVRASVRVSGPFSNTVEGIWTDVSGTMVKVIQEGDPVPGLDGFTINSVLSPVIDDHGVVMFDTVAAGPNGRPSHSIIWKYKSGVLSPLIQSGEPAPGHQPDAIFGSVGDPRSNNAGQMLFLGFVNGGGGGVFRYNDGAVTLVAKTNAQAPDAAPGVLLSNLQVLRISGAGGATFLGQLSGPGVTGPTATALWTERNGEIVMVARTGMQAPDVLAGVNFASFQTFTNPDLAVNSAGQLAVTAQLSGVGVDASNNAGIWATDLSGALRMIVREGDLFDINADPLISDFRTISTAHIAIAGSNGEDGWYTSFNDAGELVATLNFTDGSSGVFVFATAVPEPGILALAGPVIVVGLSAGRKKLRG